MDAILARFARDVQFREQAPGPRGSPQEPQAPGIGADDLEDLADTAKTESCLSSDRP